MTPQEQRIRNAAEALWTELRDRTHPDYNKRVASLVRGEVCTLLAFQELRDALDNRPPAPEVCDVTGNPYKGAE